MAKFTALAGVTLGTLIDEARRAGIAPERFSVKEAFPRLARRDSSRGGGPLDEGDLLALDSVISDPTLKELVKDGERMRSATVRLENLVVALAGEEEHFLYLLNPPSRH